MVSTQSLAQHWYYWGPSLLMVALMGLLALRAMLALALPPTSGLLRLVGGVTAPAYAPVRWLSPQAVPDTAVVIAAIAWLLAARIVWYQVCTAAGMRLSLGG